MGIKSFLFGSKPKAYSSKYNGIYEDEYSDLLHNRLGAKQLPGLDEKGRVRYDFTNVGNKIGTNEANAAYDYTPQNEAMAGFRAPGQIGKLTSRIGKMSETYSPHKFNFGNAGDIDTMATNQYGLASADENRQSGSDVELLREKMGTRRPGQLAVAGGAAQRGSAERLARIGTELRNNAMAQKLQLGKEQDIAQAGADYQGYQSRADLEGRNADVERSNADIEKANAGIEGQNLDQIYRNLTSLSDAGNQQIATKAGITKDERDYNDRGMEYMMDMIKTYLGQSNQASQLNKSGGNLGSIAGGAAKIANMI